MTILAAILFTLLVGSSFVFLYARRPGRSLRQLRGPEPYSFWLGTFHQFNGDVGLITRLFSGNEADLRYQNEVGDFEFKWMREFGSAWRRAGCFGVRAICSVTNFPRLFLLNGATDRSLNVG